MRGKRLISDSLCMKQSETETSLRAIQLFASNRGLCHWSHSAWWGTGAQRQKSLQDTRKPRAEGGPESGLEGEAGASAVLEGSTEVKVDVYKSTGVAFAYS